MEHADVVIACMVRVLYYNDIFKPITNSSYKTTDKVFKGSHSEVMTNIIRYIDDMNIQNLKKDIFEFQVDFENLLEEGWTMCIYKSYNPFHKFILQYRKEDWLVKMYPDGNHETFLKGKSYKVGINNDVPASHYVFGKTIVDDINKRMEKHFPI